MVVTQCLRGDLSMITHHLTEWMKDIVQREGQAQLASTSTKLVTTRAKATIDTT